MSGCAPSATLTSREALSMLSLKIFIDKMCGFTRVEHLWQAVEKQPSAALRSSFVIAWEQLLFRQPAKRYEQRYCLADPLDEVRMTYGCNGSNRWPDERKGI